MSSLTGRTGEDGRACGNHYITMMTSRAEVKPGAANDEKNKRLSLPWDKSGSYDRPWDALWSRENIRYQTGLKLDVSPRIHVLRDK